MKQPASTKLLFKIERTRIVLDKEDSDGLDPDALLVAMEDVGTDNNANSKPTLSALLDLSEDIESVNLARMNSIQAKHSYAAIQSSTKVTEASNSAPPTKQLSQIVLDKASHD